MGEKQCDDEAAWNTLSGISVFTLQCGHPQSVQRKWYSKKQMFYDKIANINHKHHQPKRNDRELFFWKSFFVSKATQWKGFYPLSVVFIFCESFILMFFFFYITILGFALAVALKMMREIVTKEISISSLQSILRSLFHIIQLIHIYVVIFNTGNTNTNANIKHVQIWIGNEFQSAENRMRMILHADNKTTNSGWRWRKKKCIRIHRHWVPRCTIQIHTLDNVDISVPISISIKSLIHFE